MADFAHSSMRDATIIPPRDKNPHRPRTHPITTTLYLRIRKNVCGPSTNLVDDVADTLAGKAFETLLDAVKEEKGYKSKRWGPNQLEENAILVFIRKS